MLMKLDINMHKTTSKVMKVDQMVLLVGFVWKMCKNCIFMPKCIFVVDVKVGNVKLCLFFVVSGLGGGIPPPVRAAVFFLVGFVWKMCK